MPKTRKRKDKTPQTFVQLLSICVLTIAAHAHSQTLLQPTVLASVPVMLGDLATLGAAAGVAELLADGPLEEALATLAADGAVVAA